MGSQRVRHNFATEQQSGCSVGAGQEAIDPLTNGPNLFLVTMGRGFSDGSVGKKSTCNIRGSGSIPESGRSHGVGSGDPLQHSCLENPLDREAWWAMGHRVTKSWMWLSTWHTHTIGWLLLPEVTTSPALFLYVSDVLGFTVIIYLCILNINLFSLPWASEMCFCSFLYSQRVSLIHSFDSVQPTPHIVRICVRCSGHTDEKNFTEILIIFWGRQTCKCT